MKNLLAIISAVAIIGYATSRGAAIQASGGTTLLYNGSNNAAYGGFLVSPDSSGSNGSMFTSSQFAQYPFTPVLGSGTAYATGEVIGQPFTLTNAARQNGGGAELKSIIVLDGTSQALVAGVLKSPITFLVFDVPALSGTVPILTGTYIDHSQIGISPADLPHLIRSISLSASSYLSVSSSYFATADIAVNEPMVSNTGYSSFTVVPVASGTTPATTGSNSLTFKYGVTKD